MSIQVIETALCSLFPGIFSQWSELYHNFLDRSHIALRFFICDEFVFNLHLACSFLIYLHRDSLEERPIKGAVINYTREEAGREIHGLRNQNLKI